MKYLLIAKQFVDGALWLLLHLLSAVLVVIGVLVKLLDSGIGASLAYIKQIQVALAEGLGK